MQSLNTVVRICCHFAYSYITPGYIYLFSYKHDNMESFACPASRRRIWFPLRMCILSSSGFFFFLSLQRERTLKLPSFDISGNSLTFWNIILHNYFLWIWLRYSFTNGFWIFCIVLIKLKSLNSRYCGMLFSMRVEIHISFSVWSKWWHFRYSETIIINFRKLSPKHW